ncbi:MAG TPA: hypothetical protein VMS43_14030 [Allosphingosinicella sp.]|nr:hypothetical protein [Allosphingosinicella sp.]
MTDAAKAQAEARAHLLYWLRELGADVWRVPWEFYRNPAIKAADEIERLDVLCRPYLSGVQDGLKQAIELCDDTYRKAAGGSVIAGAARSCLSELSKGLQALAPAPIEANDLADAVEACGTWIDHLPLLETQDRINACYRAADALRALQCGSAVEGQRAGFRAGLQEARRVVTMIAAAKGQRVANALTEIAEQLSVLERCGLSPTQADR